MLNRERLPMVDLLTLHELISSCPFRFIYNSVQSRRVLRTLSSNTPRLVAREGHVQISSLDRDDLSTVGDRYTLARQERYATTNDTSLPSSCISQP